MTNFQITPNPELIYEAFDKRQQVQREVRQIFTGNLLRAYEKFKGSLINYTDRGGNIRQGLLAPKDFDLEKSLEQQPVSLPTVKDARRFLEQGGVLMTLDERLAIKPLDDGSYYLQTPRAKDIGGRYFLDDEITEAAGNEFFSVSDRMACSVVPERMDAVLETLIDTKGYTLAAFQQRDKARSMLGITLLSIELPDERELDEGESGRVGEGVSGGTAKLQPEERDNAMIQSSDLGREELSQNNPELKKSPVHLYLEAKEQHPEALVFLRVGDFYETFFDDAQTLADELEFIMTRKNSGDPALGRVPMTGVPHYAWERYRKQLEDKGYQVATLDENQENHSQEAEVQNTQTNENKSKAPSPAEPSHPKPRTENKSKGKRKKEKVAPNASITPNSEPRTPNSKSPPPLSEISKDQSGIVAKKDEVKQLSLCLGQEHTPENLKTPPADTNKPDVLTKAFGQEQKAGTLVTARIPQSSRNRHPSEPNTLDTLRMWYRAARALGYSDGVLRNITALGHFIKKKQGKGDAPEISPITRKKMEQDLTAYQELQQKRGQRIVDAARFILAHTGDTSEPGQTTYRGQHYQLLQSGSSLIVQRLGNPHPQTIFSCQDGRIIQNHLNEQDDQRFASFVERLKAQEMQKTAQVACR